MIQEYDPSIRWARHIMAVTYMQWDYKATFEISMGGNCKGFNVLDMAIEQHADDLFDQQGENPEIVLTRPAKDGQGEDTLSTSPDGDDVEEWLRKMCVGLQIVDRIEDAAKQGKEAMP